MMKFIYKVAVLLLSSTSLSCFAAPDESKLPKYHCTDSGNIVEAFSGHWKHSAPDNISTVVDRKPVSAKSNCYFGHYESTKNGTCLVIRGSKSSTTSLQSQCRLLSKPNAAYNPPGSIYINANHPQNGQHGIGKEGVFTGYACMRDAFLDEDKGKIAFCEIFGSNKGPDGRKLRYGTVTFKIN